jgi:hypothetical protein
MSKPEKFLIFVDTEKYEWDKPTITGAQIRVLAAVPENVQIFLAVPGKPDQEILNDTEVDLAAHHGPARFSTQSPGSQAG